MKSVLITGPSGNTGIEIIKHLQQYSAGIKTIVAVRNIPKAKETFKSYKKLVYCQFDFELEETYNNIPEETDCIFLLRPPHISDVKKYFFPLIETVKEKKIKEIVFLSVQGADKSKIIPHNKIEKLIVESGIDYIFLRPSYFMQNLTGDLLHDIRKSNRIFIPAGKAKFNWIDTLDIGKAAAHLIINFEEFKNRAYDITGIENLSFSEVKDIINHELNIDLKYISPALLNFYLKKRKQNIEPGKILVMIFLHFLPRFQKEPVISDFYEKISGRKPAKINEFIRREENQFTGL
jgi:uncharacterized protein YbjT (DUF2867 family)